MTGQDGAIALLADAISYALGACAGRASARPGISWRAPWLA